MAMQCQISGMQRTRCAAWGAGGVIVVWAGKDGGSGQECILPTQACMPAVSLSGAAGPGLSQDANNGGLYSDHVVPLWCQLHWLQVNLEA